MAEGLTSIPSITLLSSLPSELDEGLRNEISLRLTIAAFSQSTDGAHWNTRNFARRLLHFNNRLAVVVCELHGTQVRIGKCEYLEADKFFALISRSRARFFLLFWGEQQTDISSLTLPENVLISSFTRPDGIIIYATVAELVSLSWGTLSLRENPVRVDAIVGIVERLLEIGVEASGTNLEKLRGKKQKEVAWTSQNIYCESIDFRKFLENSRSEQKSDTLKRILDEETRSISYDSSIVQRKGRVQALFWLLEVGDDFEPGILKLSSTFRMLSDGEDFLVETARATVRPRNSIDKGSLKKFVEAFVEVPSGNYLIGEMADAGLSEPPSTPRHVSIPSFLMLSRPVTYEDWLLFCQPASSWSLVDEDLLKPVVGMNIAEAMLFAEYVTQTLTDAGVLPINASVEIPEEEVWEVAARGPDSRQYPWGNEFDRALCNADQTLGTTSRVYAFSPGGDSIFGCSDMAGNVREWTSSKVPTSSFWGKEVIGERTGLAHVSATDRYVVRGGSYSYDGECVRSWVRNTQVAARPGPDLQTGFRLVVHRK